MRTTRFSETEIIYGVKQVEMGISIREIARKYGVCENTIYRWRRKYDGLSPSELRRLKDLERENSQLKKIPRFEVSVHLSPETYFSRGDMLWGHSGCSQLGHPLLDNFRTLVGDV